jgi:hypothetical protein
MTNRTSVVKDFWLAIVRNDWDEAEAAVLLLEAPFVSVSASYSFELVEGEERQAEEKQEDTSALVPLPQGDMSDTPKAMVDVWNVDVGVTLVAVSKRKTCGARVTDGEVDFLACAGPMDWPGGTSCGWATHEFGGKDAKKRTVLKMDLPKIGVAYAIPAKPSGSLVQQPKVFSLLILLKDHLPFPKTIQWGVPLTTFKFKARDWKYLIEEYQGPTWFAECWLRDRAPRDGDRPTSLKIPSPTMGRGGYSPEDFQDQPP